MMTAFYACAATKRGRRVKHHANSAMAAMMALTSRRTRTARGLPRKTPKSLANEAIGKRRAGNTRKVHLTVDAYGLPIAFRITGGEVHDSREAPALIDDLPAGDALVADKGHDSERIREQVDAKGMAAVIAHKRNSRYRDAHLLSTANVFIGSAPI